MSTQEFYGWLLNAGMILAGALALYYAMTNPDTRARNVIVSIMLFGLVFYRVWNLHV